MHCAFDVWESQEYISEYGTNKCNFATKQSFEVLAHNLAPVREAASGQIFILDNRLI